MSSNTFPHRYQIHDHTVRWGAITIPDNEELSERKDGEITIPYNFTGCLNLWAVPKCDAYPDGYWPIITTGDYYNTSEPGFECWRRKLLFTIRFSGSDERYVDDDSDNYHNSTAEPSVEFVDPCMTQALDTSQLSIPNTEIAYLDIDEKVSVQGKTAFPAHFHGDIERIENLTLTPTPGIEILNNDIVIADENHSFTASGTKDELNNLFNHLYITATKSGMIEIHYDPEQQEIMNIDAQVTESLGG